MGGFLPDDEEEDWESDGEGELASIVPSRSDLLKGGARILYLGWLLRVQAGDIADSVTAPDVPAGLARLSGSEAALIEFLRIDHHLMTAGDQGRSASAWPTDTAPSVPTSSEDRGRTRARS